MPIRSSVGILVDIQSNYPRQLLQIMKKGGPAEIALKTILVNGSKSHV